VANTIDPLGGSYFVEALTDQLERHAYDYFRRIDELGGMVAAVKANFPQREIADAAFELQTEIDRGERIVVGVNAYRHEGEDQLPILRIDPSLEGKQVGRVRAVRARRDAGAVERELGVLKEHAARPDANLMPQLLQCARVHATEGEIVDALQHVFGSYTETPVF
jgi:methylmalonyl-CoA mutase N-terminal domain/subunit